MKWHRLTARITAKAVFSALEGRACMLVSVTACLGRMLERVRVGLQIRPAAVKSMMQSH
jgi:hypothetical protein